MWLTNKEYSKTYPIYKRPAFTKADFLFNEKYESQLNPIITDYMKTNLFRFEFKPNQSNTLFKDLTLVNTILNIRDENNVQLELVSVDTLENNNCYVADETFSFSLDDNLSTIYVLKEEKEGDLYITVRYTAFGINNNNAILPLIAKPELVKQILYKETVKSKEQTVTLDFISNATINSNAVINIDLEFKLLSNLETYTVFNNTVNLTVKELYFYPHSESNYLDIKKITMDSFTYYKAFELKDLYNKNRQFLINENYIILF